MILLIVLGLIPTCVKRRCVESLYILIGELSSENPFIITTFNAYTTLFQKILKLKHFPVLLLLIYALTHYLLTLLPYLILYSPL